MQQQLEESSETMWEKKLLQAPRCVKKEGGRGAPGARPEILLQPVEQTIVRQAVPCSPWRSTVEQTSTCSPWRTSCRSRWMHPKEAVTLWEAHTGAGSWQDLWPRGRPMLEQFVPEGLQPYGSGPHWSSSWRTVAHGKDSSWKKFVENCLPWEGPHARAGEESEKSALRQRQRGMNWLQPPFPCATWGKVEKLGVKSSLGRREGWREGFLRFSFYFSLSYSDLIGNKLN